MSTAWYWPDWGACSSPQEESCSDAGCPVHGTDDLPAEPGDDGEVSAADVTHYLNRTEAECVAAGQTSICLGCQALGHPAWDGKPSWGGRDAVTEWREELGYDPITGEAL